MADPVPPTPPRRDAKDFSIVNSLKVWTGAPSDLTVTEFFLNLEAAAMVGSLNSDDIKHILRLKLAGAASDFWQCRPDLHAFAYEDIKRAFETRFKEKLPENYYYTQFQTAVQRENETVEAFADRVKSLGLKTIKETSNPEEKRILKEEAERRTLAAYIAGLRGQVGCQVKLGMPRDLGHAVSLAVCASNMFNNGGQQKDQTFRKMDHVFITCEVCRKEGHLANSCRQRQRFGSKQYSLFSKDKKGYTESDLPKHTPPPQGRTHHYGQNYWEPSRRKCNLIECWNCKKRGHVASECTIQNNPRPLQPQFARKSGNATASKGQTPPTRC